MRDIKSRGKRIDNGKWVYGSLLIDYVTGKFFIHAIGNSVNDSDKVGEEGILNFVAFEVIPETAGQYTGLKDKNGKEIYEGDVVAFEDSDGGYEYPDVVVNTGIVEYGELRFYFTNRVAAEMDDFYIKDGRCDDVEVIGNIHENPELLGVE